MATQAAKDPRVLNSYNLTQYTFPSDLTANAAYSDNNVVFFINVAANSRRVKGNNLVTNVDSYELWDIPESDQVKKAAGGQAVAALAQETNIAAGSMKRLSVAIALYVPNALNQMTSVTWGEEDLTSVLGDMADAAAKESAAANAAINETEGLIEKTRMAMGGAIATAGGVIGAGVGGSIAQKLRETPILQKYSRQTPGNTKQELLFNGVGFREFDFNYQFAPKSISEAENVMNIIRMFKHHMLPEFANDSKSMYIYPSEFNVKYFKGNDENIFIEKQITAVLMSVGIDYTPNGQFNTFENGMPQQINLTLRFKELSPPSKETSPFDEHGV
jgi:hypothetical protein